MAVTRGGFVAARTLSVSLVILRFYPESGGWWLVAGGWWLVAGGWWLVAGGFVARFARSEC
jgi:hypothetical protein